MAIEPDHLVKSFDTELQQLNGMLTNMGGKVESQVGLAANAIIRGDAVAATRVVEEDPKVDTLERDVEQIVIRLLALRQPVAGDLRRIVAGLKISRDLERIGDYAANIAKRSIVLGQFSVPYSRIQIARMAHLVQDQLKSIVDALSEDDTETAMEVWHAEPVIDDAYNALFRELITYMIEDPRNITPCTHLLFVAKNLERMGDHVVNIAETLYYTVTGELPPARPAADASTVSIVRPKE